MRQKTLIDAVTGKVSTQIGQKDPQTGVWEGGYDELGRPVAVTDTDNGKTFTTVATYNANQQPDFVEFGSADQTELSYGYYPTTGYGSTGSPVTTSGGAISYNQQDQITGREIKTIQTDGAVTTNTDTQLAYGYDATRDDALTSVSGTRYGTQAVGGVTSGLPGVNIAYNYGFDQAGNFTGNASLGSANNLNQYSALTYNARGDVTDDGTYAYQYDANDRLIKITPHDTTQIQLGFGYDSQGRRLWKDAYTYADGAWAQSYSRSYVWDGNNLVAELDGNGKLLTGYTWGPTGLLAVTDYTGTSAVTYLAVEDLSGNVSALMNPDGTLAALFSYDPYGNPVSATGPAAAVGLFRGKGLLADPETPDLQHAVLRDARLNQWLERDPAGEFQGGLNLHQLYDGDPANKSDPSGLESRTITQVSLEAIAEAKQDYGTSWVQNYDWIYQAKTRWYRRRDVAITIPNDGTPSMYYMSPTAAQVAGQYVAEARNAINTSIAAVLNNTVVGTNCLHELDPESPIISKVITPDMYLIANNYNADPNAKSHTETMTKSVIVAEGLAGFFFGIEGEITQCGTEIAPVEGVYAQGRTLAHSSGAVETATGSFEPTILASERGLTAAPNGLLPPHAVIRNSLGPLLLPRANDSLSDVGSVVHPNVPEWTSGPARGVFRVEGIEVPLRSGETGPGEYLANLPGGIGTGLNAQIPSHVEGHVAGLYHDFGLEYGELLINKPPCWTGAMCRYNLGRILPPNKVLDVHFPNRSGGVSTWRFTGGVERWEVIR